MRGISRKQYLQRIFFLFCYAAPLDSSWGSHAGLFFAQVHRRNFFRPAVNKKRTAATMSPADSLFPHYQSLPPLTVDTHRLSGFPTKTLLQHRPYSIPFHACSGLSQHSFRLGESSQTLFCYSTFGVVGLSSLTKRDD